MKIAITGGTGFVGRHFAERMLAEGHELVLISRHAGNGTEMDRVSRVASDLSDANVLAAAFQRCEAVAHCAGINRELGEQTYQRVHVEGTRNVVDAARRAGVRRIALMSFLRARPDCESPYHESKWAAEELVRNSGLDYTVIKAGMVYGTGDHMLDHLSHAFYTFPLLATVGLRERPIRPLAIDDLVNVLRAALVEGRLAKKTLAVTGAEELTLSEAARRVARVVGRRAWIFPAPIAFHRVLAQVCEWTMKVPLVAKAQVQILVEGVVEAATPCDPLPVDLLPVRRFTPEQIRGGLPEPGRFGLRDLRCCG
ncbi:MAG TPA: NAD(P)H-binding protein [Candidatus Dormibacteraeota bacterium]|nr:NAD(P)H-binding protein [Candidatus Dormibacteraeota bacterium]